MPKTIWKQSLSTLLLITAVLLNSGCRTRVVYPTPPNPFVRPTPSPVTPAPQPPPTPTPVSGVLPAAVFESLSKGMTEAQIIEKVGLPKNISLPDQLGFYYWHYKCLVGNQIRDVELKMSKGILVDSVVGF